MKTICVDFDGVLHSYTSGWVSAGVIPDPPVEGSIKWLKEALKQFEVVILSARATWPEGKTAIHNWLIEQGLTHLDLRYLTITDRKPPATLYIDDNAWLFKGPGTLPSPKEIIDWKSWVDKNKK